ncbi:unnamed protein product [Didymodactylos carnosus]|uniref:Serpin domain-containing protein n=1 Tax=Didymodactylos carnosus TaxID=1234261 RepID=A0A814UT55_9BILA|nr:unnamed protein product [Didymodactylos carnosus]CAF3942732.1 unnamed protein product [Didymodactylos carnosus]
MKCFPGLEMLGIGCSPMLRKKKWPFPLAITRRAVNCDRSQCLGYIIQMSTDSFPLVEFPPITFRCDRSFIYMIREHSSSITLFQGRFIKP